MDRRDFKDVKLSVITHNITSKIYIGLEEMIDILSSEESKNYIRSMLLEILHAKLDKVGNENQG